ncbi:MAG: hypothetical protein KAR08_09240, partial [Candidatus Heimdallarchaeota archaeon]|nr:hypothetical protein [Candidatus Heimdallarchaeota archaeon]
IDSVWLNSERFHIFWCSHSLEHFLDVEGVLEKIKRINEWEARLCVILPYPDLDPAPAHTASVQLGLNIDDEGKTVIKFFEDRGFKLVRHKFDDYREPEIWLDLVKSDE